jgi:hypothetical protein
MVGTSKQAKASEIEKRAARIRSQWSFAEQVRRTGLPPDVPSRLRELALGHQQAQWCMVTPERSAKTRR